MYPNLAPGQLPSKLMTVAVAVLVAAEHVVETLQEEEHDDAPECREAIQGVKDVGIASLRHLHGNSLEERNRVSYYAYWGCEGVM